MRCCKGTLSRLRPTCIGRLLAIVKLGIGGRALYVLVSAVSVRPNMEPDVKDTISKNMEKECFNIL